MDQQRMSKRISEMKDLKYEQVLLQSQEIENQRKSKALATIQEEELKAMERASVMDEVNRHKQLQIAAKEEYRQSVKRNSEMNYKEKSLSAYENLEKKTEMSVRAINQRESDLYQKKQSNLLRSEEKKENVNRVFNVKAYQRDKLQERINDESEKVQNIKSEKMSIKEEKLAFKNEMDRMKKEISSKFEAVRQGKVIFVIKILVGSFCFSERIWSRCFQVQFHFSTIIENESFTCEEKGLYC